MIKLRAIRLHECDIPLRMPFRFGVVELTSLRHMVVSAEHEVARSPAGRGRSAHGFAGENLVPKWFTKDPATTLDEDVHALREAIRAVARKALELPPAADPFQFWLALHGRAAEALPAVPPLVRQLTVSLLERAAIDAWCRDANQPFWRLLHEGSLGFSPELVHRELTGEDWRAALPSFPASSLDIRHTVGMADTVEELPAILRRTGIRRLKIKLSGDVDADERRLRHIVTTAEALVDRITLDGNENYRSISAMTALLQRLRESPLLEPIRDRLAWIEQPLHRDLALGDKVGPMLTEFDEFPVVIDESDASPHDLPRALRLGYAGTTHKNCKGVFKSVVAATLLARHRRLTGRRTILSGEDLTIVAPLSQTQDLAIAAAVGVVDIERNGQHYADGLAAFDAETNRRACTDHPDTYSSNDRSIAALRIENGSITIGSVNAAPLGTPQTPRVQGFDEVAV